MSTEKNNTAATPTVLEASSKQTFTDTERHEILKAFESRPSDQSAANFAKKNGISTATLSTWRKKYAGTKGKSTKKTECTAVTEMRKLTNTFVGNGVAAFDPSNQAEVLDVVRRLSAEVANASLENAKLKTQLEQFQAAYGRLALHVENKNWE